MVPTPSSSPPWALHLPAPLHGRPTANRSHSTPMPKAASKSTWSRPWAASPPPRHMRTMSPIRALRAMASGSTSPPTEVEIIGSGRCRRTAVMPCRSRPNSGIRVQESPDGAHIYYNEVAFLPGALWRLPVSGGQPVKMVDRVVWSAFAVVRQVSCGPACEA